jgi:hypothetical protein
MTPTPNNPEATPQVSGAEIWKPIAVGSLVGATFVCLAVWRELAAKRANQQIEEE